MSLLDIPWDGKIQCADNKNKFPPGYLDWELLEKGIDAIGTPLTCIIYDVYVYLHFARNY